MALPPPPAPPPPPPPPPIGEAIPPSYPGPAPSMQPVTTAQPAPDAQTASQPNTTPGNEDKIWERSWTVDELRKGSSNWTLAADSGFLLYLQEFSQRIISQTHDIETQVDGLINSTKGMDSKVQNTMNDFLMLSNTQFIENRVYEEDVSKDETNEEKEKAPEPEKAKTREQLEAEVIPKLSEALSHGVGVMDNAFVAVELTTEHSDDEEEDDDAKTAFKPQVILEPKDVYSNRPLPHLIGSGDFFRDELVGLGESSGEEDEGEEDEEEASSSSSGSETESTASGESSSESSEESGSESDTEKLKETEKKQKSKPKKIIESEEDDDDLFGEKKKPPDSDEEDEKSDDEEEQPKKPKGGLDFASELAARIGVAKVKQPDSDEDDNKDKVADGEWSDEENQESKTVEVQEKQRSLTKNSLTKSRSDSKTKEKKSHHHHHHHHQHHDKRERTESQGEHKHRKRRGSKTSHSSVDKHSVTAEDDLFSQSSPQEDGLFGGEGTPFTKKGGLFSGGGNLFDDVDEDKGDLFAEASTTKTNKQEVPTEAEEESVQVKPRARSTASGKKIPAGAISIFGDSGLFGSPSPTKEDITTSLTKNHQKHEETETKPKPKSGGGGGGLFDGDDDDDLFSGTTFKPSAASPVVQETAKTKPAANKVDLFGADNEDEDDEGDLFSGKPVAKEPAQAPPKKKLPAGAVSMFGSSPPPLLMGKNTIDDEEKDDTGLFKASAVAPKKTEVKTSPASQLTKSKSGGGLFSDEDEEEGGGLFGASATKPQPKEEPKSRPKTKTTISLFDDDEQDEEEDFFAAPAVSKPAKNEPTKDKPKEEVKETKAPSAKISGLFDDDDEDLFNSPSPKPSPSPNVTRKEDKKEETKPNRSSSKMQSLFDADDDDEGMFGGTSEDIFIASTSPQKSFESVSPLSAAISETVPPLDGTDEVSISKAKPKPSATTAAAPKASLFSDEDDDLFGGNSVEEPKVEEKKEVISESPKPRKPVGAVSMFGGVDLFAGKRPSFLGEKNNAESSEPVKKEEDKPATTEKEADLFGSEQAEDELFSSKPKTTKPMAPPSKAKPSSDLFGASPEDDLFSAPSKPPSEPKPVKPPVISKPDVEDGPTQPVEPVEPVKPVEPVRPKKPAGAVSMFGGVDLFGGSKSPPFSVAAAKSRVPVKPKDPLGGDDEEDLFSSKSKVKKEAEPEPSGPLPVPKAALPPFPSSVSPKTSPVKLGSGIEKLQKSLAFNPAMLRPGAAPPKKEAPATVASFDEPAKVTTLESTNKARAKVQVKRRPPTRQARRAAAATSSASDASLFGTSTNEDESISARVSWGGFPSPEEGLGKSEVDSGQRPSRTETKDSDMSDEFFGFTSSESTRVKKDVSEDPLAGGLFSDSVSSKPKVSTANELFKDDSDDLFSISIEKTNKTDVDDPFSVGKTKEENKPKTADPLITNDSSPNLPSATSPEDDLFSSGTNTKERKSEAILKETPSKDKEDSKISSPLDNDDLLSAVPKADENVTKTIAAKDTLSAKLPANLSAKAQSPVSDGDLFASSTGKEEGKSDKGEKEKTTADKKFPSPLGDDDDDLFAVSAPAKKETKTISDSAAKKTASPLTSKKAVTKGSSILDEDDDELFSVKKTEARKPKKVVKPLGDDDLFGDSGDIFSDIPSKPKGPKKKKSATTAPKDDIFAEGAATGGDEQAPKKTATKAKKKTDKKPKTSIFDDDVPSIFDDPLNATSK